MTIPVPNPDPSPLLPHNHQHDETDQPLKIAIIGSGITGLVLALGLLHRNLHSFKLYERAPTFGELGVGITATPNSERALALVHPAAHAAFAETATEAEGGLLTFVDSYNEPESGWGEGGAEGGFIHALDFAKGGFRVARRCDFVEKLAEHVPGECVEFGKEVVGIEEDGGGGKGVRLRFGDGTTAEADVVIGCDGIRSRIRDHLFPPLSKTRSKPTTPVPAALYSHQLGFRTTVPFPLACSVLGEKAASKATMHTGPGAFALTIPLSRVGLAHVEVFVIDPAPWPTTTLVNDSDDDNNEAANGDRNKKKKKKPKYVLSATKSEAASYFSDFGPTVRAIVDRLLPEEGLDKWAVFDMLERPAATYAKGCVAIAGDAAHASTPNHGGGAGMGIEDALALAEVLAAVVGSRGKGGGKAEVVERALKVYDEVRRERSQWLVESSRRMVELYSWKDGEEATKRSGLEMEERSHKLWDYDVNDMVKEALGKLKAGSAA